MGNFFLTIFLAPLLAMLVGVFVISGFFDVTEWFSCHVFDRRACRTAYAEDNVIGSPIAMMLTIVIAAPLTLFCIYPFLHGIREKTLRTLRPPLIAGALLGFICGFVFMYLESSHKVLQFFTPYYFKFVTVGLLTGLFAWLFHKPSEPEE